MYTGNFPANLVPKFDFKLATAFRAKGPDAFRCQVHHMRFSDRYRPNSFNGYEFSKSSNSTSKDLNAETVGNST